MNDNKTIIVTRRARKACGKVNLNAGDFNKWKKKKKKKKKKKTRRSTF